MIVLDKFPMPPSINECYITRRAGTKTWRAPSKVLEQYKGAVTEYWKQHSSVVRAARAEMKLMTTVAVSSVFVFARHRIFTKDNRPKRLDTDNRFKALHDGLKDLLGVDDCAFWSPSGEKVYSDGAVEYVIVKIESCVPRHEADARLDLGLPVPW